MRSRFIRIPPSAAAGTAASLAPAAVGTAASLAPTALPVLSRPSELSLHDWAVFLLHTAAEVEHALLVQYLFAAYSIKPQAIPGTNPVIQTTQWQREIVKIAKEEMGHLLTLQNVMRLIGGPPNLEREDFPMRTLFYPFPFALERFTKDSLAKYVFAEMPEGDIDPAILTTAERAEIETRARTTAGMPGGTFLNHVGTLYRTIDHVFRDPALDGFRPGRFHYQSRAADPWLQTVVTPPATAFPTGVILSRLTGRDQAVEALTVIARQGEAAENNQELMKSHFGRFLTIYKSFPDGFVPSHPVATNPNTNRGNPTPATITHPETFVWGQLFNVRYRILLAMIGHSVLVPSTVPGQPDQLDPASGNATLVQWVYDEMVHASGSIRDLARRLAQIPLAATGTATAGAPFELPYTLALPDQESDRWRVHADLIAASADLIATLKAPPIGLTDTMLDDILATDALRLPEIQTRMNAS